MVKGVSDSFQNFALRAGECPMCGGKISRELSRGNVSGGNDQGKMSYSQTDRVLKVRQRPRE